MKKLITVLGVAGLSVCLAVNQYQIAKAKDMIKEARSAYARTVVCRPPSLEDALSNEKEHDDYDLAKGYLTNGEEYLDKTNIALYLVGASLAVIGVSALWPKRRNS